MNSLISALLESRNFEILANFHEILENSLNLLQFLHQSRDSLQKNRNLSNISNIFLLNSLVLLSFYPKICESSLFSLTISRENAEILELSDQCNIDSYAILFRYLEFLYIPELLQTFRENSDNFEKNLEKMLKFMRVCRDNLVENCKWTFRYREVSFLMGFLLNERLFLSENIAKTSVFSKFIMETWEIGSKYWLVQRAMVDQLFKILWKFPELMGKFADLIVFLLKSKETRGFDSNLLFYLDEFFVPVFIEFSKNFIDFLV